MSLYDILVKNVLQAFPVYALLDLKSKNKSLHDEKRAVLQK